MKQKQTILLFILISIFTKSVNAQYYFYNDKYYNGESDIEIGISAGGINALTDLGGKSGKGKKFIKDLNLKNTQLNAGVYAVATFKNSIGLRIEAMFGNVKAYDSILSNDNKNTRYLRNLSFRSPITEFSAMLEIHPLMFKNYDIAEQNVPRLSPFIAAGIGMFTFNPQTQINGTWVNLQPLHTEGQGFKEYPERKEYKLTQMNIPVGIGLKYELGALFNARLEIIHRFLFTDYLDDVSTNYIDPSLFANYLSPAQAALATQLYNRSKSTDPNFSAPDATRGISKNNDAYFTINVKLGFNISRKKRD